MKRRYKHLADGEPRVIPGRRGKFPHRIMCCDCGLVHTVLLKLTGPNKLLFVAWREKRATAAARKHRQHWQ